MEIKYRTFQDGDEDGIVKLFNSAFCKTRFCQPQTREFWKWKYKTRPPRFIPEGIMLAEKKGTIVGSVIVTFHKMRFGKSEFLLGGIDDVATCPLLEKRGIARNLMERAIEFTRNYGADASVLMADPHGHACRLYNKLGYDYTTYFSLFFKMINPLKLKNEILPLAPLTPFIYLTKLKSKKKKEIKNIQFQVQKADQRNFIIKLNKNYKNLIGSNIYDEKYWQWFRINRPKRYKSIMVTAYKNEKLIGGGTILKSYFLVLKYILSHYVISDLFVDPEMRKKGIGRSILNKLESYAARESSFILAFIHKYNFDMKLLLKQSGYFSTPNAEMEMIKPITKDYIQIYELQKGLKKPWIAPLEQSGF